MSLRIGDKVKVTKNVHGDDIDHARAGSVVNLKWNMIQVRFDDGECEWVDGKLVRIWIKDDFATPKT